MAETPLVMPGAAPYFARGGATGVLLLHGFTASPHEVKWLAEHLAADGHTVYAPRIAGHGTDYRDLARSRWQDWAASALDGVSVLRAQCERVMIGGLSMGGALALYTAAHTEVAGVIALAAPVVPFATLTGPRMRVAKLLRPFTDQTDRTPFAESVLEQQKRRGEPPLGRVRYNLWSSAAVEQLQILIEATRLALPRVSAPVLAVYSQGDATVRPAHLETLKAGLTGAQIDAHLLNDSPHILTQGVEQETVFALVANFVARVGAEGAPGA
jgi:carboxylesterase